MSQQLDISEKTRKSFEQKISELSIQLTTANNHLQLQTKKAESAVSELKQLSKTESQSNERVQHLQNLLSQTERRLLTAQKQSNEYQCQIEESKARYIIPYDSYLFVLMIRINQLETQIKEASYNQNNEDQEKMAIATKKLEALVLDMTAQINELNNKNSILQRELDRYKYSFLPFNFQRLTC